VLVVIVRYAVWGDVPVMVTEVGVTYEPEGGFAMFSVTVPVKPPDGVTVMAVVYSV